jgi:hypothetical protein
MLSTIILIITRGWHNRPGVAAVPIVKKKEEEEEEERKKERKKERKVKLSLCLTN